MFAKGRTTQQQMIDNRADILIRTICEIKQHIERAFDEESDHRKIAKEIAEGDYEIEASIMQSFASIYRYDDKHFMLELFEKAMIAMVDSYCENTLKYIGNKIKKQNNSKGKTKIESLLSNFLTAHSIDVNTFICKHWPSFKEFHNLRNDIIHDDNMPLPKNVDVDYIIQNIKCAKNLLRAVDAIITQK